MRSILDKIKFSEPYLIRMRTPNGSCPKTSGLEVGSRIDNAKTMKAQKKRFLSTPTWGNTSGSKHCKSRQGNVSGRWRFDE